MVRKRYLGFREPLAEGETLGPYRSRLLEIAREYRPQGPEYQAVIGAVEALDAAIEKLTGNRDLLHLKPHGRRD